MIDPSVDKQMTTETCPNGGVSVFTPLQEEAATPEKATEGTLNLLL